MTATMHFETRFFIGALTFLVCLEIAATLLSHVVNTPLCCPT